MARPILLVFIASIACFANAEVRWFSLATEDAGRATVFYSGLFGWTIERSPSGDYVALLDGVPIAGISQIDEDIEDVEEAQWVPAFLVDDVAHAESVAVRNGATVVTSTLRTPGWGTFALLTDPEAAPFIVANIEQNIGGLTVPGSWVWADLWAKDVPAAVRFYGAVLGYDTKEIDGVRVFTSEGTPEASIVPIEDDTIEQGWAPYIGVVSLAETMEKAQALGGEILLEPSKDFADGDAALIMDPTGAAFFVYELRESS